MGDTQIPKHGNGAGCDSSHGERMHQTFFTRLGYNTQRRIDSFATQLANRRWEDVALQTATNHLKHRLMDLGKVEEDVSYNEENNNATGWDYHDEDIPRLGDFTGSGHYVATWHGHRCNELDFEIKWTNTDAQLIGKKLHDQLLYALVLHAKAQKWKQTFKVSGYTSIKKEDVTTTTINLYRSDTDFRGEPWHDWGLFYFKDDRSKPENTVNLGLILGFVRFTTPGFPTPGNLLRYPNGIPDTAIDTDAYVVARCCPDYVNIDKRFVTPVKLLKGDVSLYVIPMKDLVGPVAVVPNIFTKYRPKDEDETWLAIKPYRKWGRHFGDSIEW